MAFFNWDRVVNNVHFLNYEIIAYLGEHACNITLITSYIADSRLIIRLEIGAQRANAKSLSLVDSNVLYLGK
jgi:hypothetical protein